MGIAHPHKVIIKLGYWCIYALCLSEVRANHKYKITIVIYLYSVIKHDGIRIGYWVNIIKCKGILIFSKVKCHFLKFKLFPHICSACLDKKNNE